MVDSNRAVSPTVSPLQGSSRVAPILGWVRIVPEIRFSLARSKYSSTTATHSFQTVSLSDEGTTNGLVAAGPGVSQSAIEEQPTPPRTETSPARAVISLTRIRASSPRERGPPAHLETRPDGDGNQRGRRVPPQSDVTWRRSVPETCGPRERPSRRHPDPFRQLWQDRSRRNLRPGRRRPRLDWNVALPGFCPIRRSVAPGQLVETRRDATRGWMRPRTTRSHLAPYPCSTPCFSTGPAPARGEDTSSRTPVTPKARGPR